MNATVLASTFPGYARLLPGLGLAALVLWLFRDTALAMETIWARSDTFAHAYLVPPITAWLVWRRRAALALLPVRPAPWWLLPVAAACMLWLLGDLASVNAATQFALVTLLVLIVPTVYGWAMARALTFPLLFLFFCVPVGEFMVPYMMEWTADFTVAALQWTGIPVFREGLQFVIPSGSWSVVQACSGVRYLIASFMVGTLFAYLNYRSRLKRAAFMAVSLLVPVLANWLRAYMIVMLGHLSGNQLAAGVDHIIYGWVFFGVVIGLMFMAGGRWADADPQGAGNDNKTPVGSSAAAAASAPRMWALAGSSAVLMGAVQLFAWQLSHGVAAAPVQLALPASAGAAGVAWTPADRPGPTAGWTPAFKNASDTAEATYQRADDKVSVWVAYYRDQNYDRKLVTSTNDLVDGEHESPWVQLAQGAASADVAGVPQAFRSAVLRGSSSPGAPAAPRLRAWRVYWVGGRLTPSDAQAKLRLAFNRLLGRGDDGAVIVLFTALPDDSTVARADAAIAAYAGQGLPAVLAALEAARAAR